ncbi:MAG: carbamate kinase [Actinobacteria bacterium]|nr:carbamate kinase [Actinomycetota bacterium]
MAAPARKTGRTVVVALGGNAILQPGQLGTFEEQLFNIDGAMRRIAALAADGWRVVLTHGNGPQVGNLLIQNALAAKTVAPMPMDVCGAMSQGQIGYLAAQTLANHLAKRGVDAPVVTVVTQVAVDPADKAFENPTKPVGPFYTEGDARRMMLEEGVAMKEDAGRGWRRVVPSPEPREIVELEAVRDLVEGGCLVVCSGGGGVPVVRSRGALSGIDAVIDKDLAAALLARQLGADALLILTDVPKAYIHYGTPEQEALDTVTASQMRAYAAAGHFKAGSMGPKVEACLRFVDAGGESVIASLTEVKEALAGRAGTHIVPDDASGAKRTRAGRSGGAQGKAGASPKARVGGRKGGGEAGAGGGKSEAGGKTEVRGKTKAEDGKTGASGTADKAPKRKAATQKPPRGARRRSGKTIDSSTRHSAVAE